MIFKYPKNKWHEIKRLFEAHQYFETIIKGTLEERLGEIFVDDIKDPNNAMLRYKMYVIFGGSGKGDNLTEFFKLVQDEVWFFCPNEIWVENLKNYFNDKLTFLNRTKVYSNELDINHIRKLKENIPENYEIVKLTNELIDCFDEYFKQRYSYYYGHLDKLKEIGFGFCALYNGQIVSVAATVLPMYKKAFEIQINTVPEHQRKGLATVVCAHLIEYSLENGYDPKWDAFTEISAALALKLGYTRPKKYQLLVLNAKS